MFTDKFTNDELVLLFTAVLLVSFPESILDPHL